jgi:HAD superfamily hydrolase (TIGR01509 family)
MSLKALIFDIDGTLANTEHDGHLRAFNETFKLFELDWHWDSKLYSELLSVSGGKERLAHYIRNYNPNLESVLSVNDIVDIHNKKTEIFVNHIANGEVSLRIGVDRLIKEAIVSDLRLGIATTTSLKNVEALITSTLGETALDKFEVIGAGDVVKSKKPAPDIFQYVLDKMRLSCHECIAFEDSEIGFTSATSAGLRTVITLSEYNKKQIFEGALVVLDHLGDENQPFEIIKGNPTNHSFVSVGYLKEIYEQDR